ncbi:hypothetical protein CVT24_007277 [Panaeolus cyanescens]|uniref:RING-type domain-containing protein n=1 Tax=Panaeolus cyanescens TaxID=181874 RepID=A0A409VJ01_9AGAR|nr:hypothetical protein CVT24_007277 [Panaeolus cyanescens]
MSLEQSPDESNRKRLKETQEAEIPSLTTPSEPLNSKLVEELTQELQCGCCAELVYKPVLVIPCQHFFCGSCCVLWIRNGGTNCPACRGNSSVAMPFRALQPIIDSLLRLAPHKARTQRERDQADEVYKSGVVLEIPSPRESSPPPDVNRSTEYLHPCPHCLSNNPYGWRCPRPLVDPSVDPAHAWPLNDGTPPGHGHCGNCENLLALRAPSTSKCDLCQVSFCGIGVQDRCIALPLMAQSPHNMNHLADLIQSVDVYDCFDGNTVEVEIMLEYLTRQGLTPRYIYREIIQHIQKLPRGFATLVELDLFSDVHPVTPGAEPNPDAPRNKICRICAAEVFLWGVKEWWIRERQKRIGGETLALRRDCPDGVHCSKHREDHGRIFSKKQLYLNPEHLTADPVESSSPPLPAVYSSPVAASSSNNSLSFLLNAEDAFIPSPPDQQSVIQPAPGGPVLP